MADKVSDEQVAALLAILQKSEASVDVKVQHVAAAKSSIKHHNVPEPCVPNLLEALRLASANPHGQLAHAGFTTLNHLLTRMSLQDPRLVGREARTTLPLVVDRLGDHKEKMRGLAAQALTTIYPHAPLEVERFVKNQALAGKSSRAKEASMQWVRQMHEEHGMQFKAYVPALMELLEDADPGVRDVAKTTVMELFRNAPGPAKTDLKRQLKNFRVRPAIEAAIVKELAPAAAPAASSTGLSTSHPPRSDTPAESAPPLPPQQSPPPPPPLPPTRSMTNLSASVSLIGLERPVTPGLDVVGRFDPVEPAYVSSTRELEDLFRDMHGYFDGRETEQNWLRREESMTRLRRLTTGNGPHDFHDPFVAGIVSLRDGIIKAVSSLRTSLSREGCALVQDLAVQFGPEIDPMVELLMQTLIKLSGATKKISSQLAYVTLDVIIGRVTYTRRILEHIAHAAQDKNTQPRMYASGWLKTLLGKEAATGHKSHVEHSGGLDLVEKSIRKGLVDPTPGVREKMRSTYWMYAGIWPARAEAMMASLEPTAQKLLQKDPSNPNVAAAYAEGSGGAAAAAARPGLGFSKSTLNGGGGGGGGKPSLRETLMAQKKAALAARSLPARPGSAMSHFSSPDKMRNVSASSSASNLSATTTAAASAAATSTAVAPAPAPVRPARPEPSTTALSTGGMSVAPMRPTRKRPELVARPATAGPYSVRGHDHPSAEADSPPRSRRDATGAGVVVEAGATNKSAATPDSSPRRAGTRMTTMTSRPGHAYHASDSHIPSPVSVSRAAKQLASPKPERRDGFDRLSNSPSKEKEKENEDLTLVVPTASSIIRPTSWTAELAPHLLGLPVFLERPPLEPEAAGRHPPSPPAPESPEPLATQVPEDDTDTETIPEPEAPRTPASAETPAGSPGGLQVYEDPDVRDSSPAPPQPAANGMALEDRPINGDAGKLVRLERENGGVNGSSINGGVDGGVNGIITGGGSPSPDKLARTDRSVQNARLLDSGIKRIKARTLDAHGFRKLQSLLRDSSGSNASPRPDGLMTDTKFDALVTGLFQYLEDPLSDLSPAKSQDVKTQVLATIRLLLRRDRASFQPHIARGLEAVLATRSAYENRAHMVSGLEVLADDLAAIGDPPEMVMAVTRRLRDCSDASTEGCRCLGTGMMMLRGILDRRAGCAAFNPSEQEVERLTALAGRGLDSADSGVRMNAVLLCVALHGRIGDGRFWAAMRGTKEDPKNLITYYIVRRQQERAAAVVG